MASELSPSDVAAVLVDRIEWAEREECSRLVVEVLGQSQVVPRWEGVVMRHPGEVRPRRLSNQPVVMSNPAQCVGGSKEAEARILPVPTPETLDGIVETVAVRYQHLHVRQLGQDIEIAFNDGQEARRSVQRQRDRQSRLPSSRIRAAS